MKKRIVGIAALTAALTLASGMTAFAGTWLEDSHGKYYQNDDGSRPVYAGWFTDPDTQIVYGMDPDGYLMINGSMGAQRTDGEGRRIDPTEEDLQRAEERKAELARRDSPAKQQASAELAAVSAKSSMTASGTTRLAFATEMDALSNEILTQVKSLRTNTTLLASHTEDSAHVSYGYRNPDDYWFLSSTSWKSIKPTSADYKEYAYDLMYHFDAAADDTDRHIYDDAFGKLTVAALGSTQGQATVDYVNAQRTAGVENFDYSGTTDTGNTFTIKYRYNVLNMYVVCSEIVPEDTSEAENTAETESTTEGFTGENADGSVQEETPVQTSNVITVGQKPTDEDDAE